MLGGKLNPGVSFQYLNATSLVVIDVEKLSVTGQFPSIEGSSLEVKISLGNYLK